MFREPDGSEVFHSALRQLAFEEPASRFARMRKTIVKHCGKSDGKLLQRELEGDCLQLARVFGQIFGPHDVAEPSFSQILSLAIGLDDLRVFSDTAFNSWYQQWHQKDKAELNKKIQFSTRMESLLQLLSPASTSGQAWLRVSLLATVDWRFAESNAEVEAGDLERVSFVRDLFQKLKNESKVNALALSDLSVEELADKVRLCAALLAGKLRPNLLLLVEGKTEAIVLPHFADLCGLSFVNSGVELISSGGAKQVARRYLTIKDTVRLPIVCVLDGDAEESAELIEDSLRELDQLVSLEVVELEDSYSHDQLLFLLDEHLHKFGQSLSRSEFQIPESGRRKEALDRLFRERGLGSFDKIAFAHEVVESCRTSSDVPEEMAKVVEAVRSSLTMCS